MKCGKRQATGERLQAKGEEKRRFEGNRNMINQSGDLDIGRFLFNQREGTGLWRPVP
jgi:hypothetical protein